MGKTLNLTVKWEEDYELGSDYSRAELLLDEDNNRIYSVHNLTDCPEDAIIQRDLVSAEEIANYIEMGMKLAFDGYDSIKITYHKVDSIY